MKFSEYLAETIKPFELTNNSYGVVGKFKYGPDDRVMAVNIDDDANGIFDISFNPEDSSGRRKYAASSTGGDEISVFQTIVRIVETWYLENKDSIKCVVMTPTEDETFGNKRHSVYTRMVERFIKKYGGVMVIRNIDIMWYPDIKARYEILANVISDRLSYDTFWVRLDKNGGETSGRADGIKIRYIDANLDTILYGLHTVNTYSDMRTEVVVHVSFKNFEKLNAADSGYAKIENQLKRDSDKFIQDMIDDGVAI
jgi:hypothetical protein